MAVHTAKLKSEKRLKLQRNIVVRYAAECLGAAEK